jgi:hypothetical protein
LKPSDFHNLRQALDVGRTLTRFNFPQADVFNPLGILLAHHLTQLDEAQRNAAGGEDNDPRDDPPRPEVADAIFTTSNIALTRDPPGSESGHDGEQGTESGDGAGDGIVVRNFRSTGPILLPDDIPIDSIRVDFTAGNMRITTESTVDINFMGEGSSGALDDRSATTVAEDRTEVGASTSSERLSEGAITPAVRALGVTDVFLNRMIADSPPQIETSQPEGSCELEPPGDETSGTPTPIYHDPHPPFETDGRGRVVWSNSSEQIRLQSRPPPPVKSNNNETSVRREKENGGATGPGVEAGDSSNTVGNGDGQETGVEGAGQACLAP